LWNFAAKSLEIFATAVSLRYLVLQAVISWFPDRKGLVSGLVIAGFGSGALLFAPLMAALTGNLTAHIFNIMLLNII
jgi:hypothetical protein